ncbi:MAG TPA: hypothetical protein VFW04_10155 [Gemmatimonadaceae bacterium]|nr:hypothetical protein [Gemmatimonadaceae bacterium]
MPNRRSFSTCPTALPAELEAHLVAFAEGWARHGLRPQPSSVTRAAWDDLVTDWAGTEDLPLFVRKPSDNRGSIVLHRFGREIVPVDNSPAQWAYALACGESTLSLSEVRRLLAVDQIPVAMMLKKAERVVAKYRCALGKSGTATAGWKLGHLHPVGLGTGELAQFPIDTLKEHFRALMSPSNMFLMPSQWAGVAEIPEVIDAIRRVLQVAL